MSNGTVTGWGGIASVRRGLWYWVLWESIRAWHEGRDPKADGTAPTREEGLRQLQEAALRLGVVPPEDASGRLWARCASDWWRFLAARRRLQRPVKGTGSQPVDYVYSHEWGVPDDDSPPSWSTARFRILRRTVRYLYACREPDNEDGTCRPPWERGGVQLAETMRLDRRRLEAGEEVWHRDRRRHLTLHPNPPARAARVQTCPPGLEGCLGVLGLRWPCTATEIRSAYQRRVLECHPDRGGSTEAMRVVCEAYEQLRRAGAA
jgi:hypothetical protein